MGNGRPCKPDREYLWQTATDSLTFVSGKAPWENQGARSKERKIGLMDAHDNEEREATGQTQWALMGPPDSLWLALFALSDYIAFLLLLVLVCCVVGVGCGYGLRVLMLRK